MCVPVLLQMATFVISHTVTSGEVITVPLHSPCRKPIPDLLCKHFDFALALGTATLAIVTGCILRLSRQSRGYPNGPAADPWSDNIAHAVATSVSIPSQVTSNELFSRKKRCLLDFRIAAHNGLATMHGPGHRSYLVGNSHPRNPSAVKRVYACPFTFIDMQVLYQVLCCTHNQEARRSINIMGVELCNQSGHHFCSYSIGSDIGNNGAIGAALALLAN